MAELSVEYINPFLAAATSIMKSMCQLDVNIGKPYVKTTEFENDSLVIMIGVTGEMRGQVLIAMTEENACSIASKMCMMEVKTIDDFASSAISELGNMIMGNAATVFSSNGIGIDITPPTLSHGEVSFTSNYAKTLSVPMVFADGSGSIDLFLALRQED